MKTSTELLVESPNARLTYTLITVTMPVTGGPAGRAEVCKANWSGVQRPLRPLCDEQARCAPTEPEIQVTPEGTERLRLSEPSATLYASTVCVCNALPLVPWAMETGPTVDDTSRNRGAALRPARHRTPATASAAAPFRLRPTRELPSYKPICNRRPE